MTPEIGMLRRQSWRPHQRKQHIGSRHARGRMLRRGLGPRHGQKAHSGTYETHQRPPVVSGGGGERGTTIVRRIADGSRTAPYYRRSRRRKRGDGEKGVAGRDHDGTGEGPDTALAILAAEPRACERSGQTIGPPRVLSEEPTAVTPHGGICGGESQQWLSYPTDPHVRLDERGVETELRTSH